MYAENETVRRIVQKVCAPLCELQNKDLPTEKELAAEINALAEQHR